MDEKQMTIAFITALGFTYKAGGGAVTLLGADGKSALTFYFTNTNRFVRVRTHGGITAFPAATGLPTAEGFKEERVVNSAHLGSTMKPLLAHLKKQEEVISEYLSTP